jgi:hypothetical protein
MKAVNHNHPYRRLKPVAENKTTQTAFWMLYFQFISASGIRHRLTLMQSSTWYKVIAE